MSEALIILGLALLNGVFAGAEIAILSVRKTRLGELLAEGRRGAGAVTALRGAPERFFATVQIGITVIGAAAGAFGGSTLTVRVEPLLARLPVLGAYAHELAFIVVVSFIAYLSLVLGELVPKSLALRAAERYALITAPLLRGLAWVTRPFVWFLTQSSNAVLRIFGDKTNFTETRVSPEELQQLLDEASRTGAVHPRVGEIASRALDLGALTAFDVMIPRGQVIAVPKTARREELIELVLERGHSRMPVYEGTIDHIIGYIYAKDLTALSLEKDLIHVQDIVREATFVPETMRAVELLQMMQAKRLHQVIVVDEMGGVAGLVTMEDLVEELVGEIFSEWDEAVSLPVTRESDSTVVASGSAALREVDRVLGTHLDEATDANTVGGLCMHLANAVPERGAAFTTNGVRLEVLAATRQRIQRVRISRSEPPVPSG